MHVQFIRSKDHSDISTNPRYYISYYIFFHTSLRVASYKKCCISCKEATKASVASKVQNFYRTPDKSHDPQIRLYPTNGPREHLQKAATDLKLGGIASIIEVNAATCLSLRKLFEEISYGLKGETI